MERRKTEWQRKRDLAEGFRALATECCSAMNGAKIGKHSGDVQTCATERCKRLRDAADQLIEWEDCPGEHRHKDGRWQKEIAV